MLKRIINLYKQYQEMIRYLIFGFLTTIISLIVYYLLVYSIIDSSHAMELQIANIISWIAGVIFAYVTNRKFVFNSKNEEIGKELLNFVGARVITLVVDMLIMFVGVTLLKGNDKILKIISQIVVIVSNYIFSKLFVFKKGEKF